MFEYPSLGRVALAFTAAAGAAAAPTILTGPMVIIAFPIGCFIGLACALVLGLPAYLLLRRWTAITWAKAILAGAMIGTAPALLFALIDYTPGAVTPSATRNIFWACLVFGGFGAIGGATFRAVLGPPAKVQVDPEVFA